MPQAAFIGTCRVRGAAWPIDELQARWAVAALSGAVPLPSPQQMRDAVEERRKRLLRAGVRDPQASLTVINRVAYMDRLAGYIGARPPLLTSLLPALLLGPAIAAQYRLRGPYANVKAAAEQVRRVSTGALRQAIVLLLLAALCIALLLRLSWLGVATVRAGRWRVRRA